MYGLPQAGILANKLLRQRLGCHGYLEIHYTPAFRNTSPGQSGLICASTTLVSNTFVMRISSTSFLCYTLKCTNLLRIGLDRINLEWNYDKHWVDIAMPVYAIKSLARYNHQPPEKPQHCPYTPNLITYGKDNQATNPCDTSPLLDAAGNKCIH
jgi:hypothetical protein